MLIGRISKAIENAKQHGLTVSESRLPFTYHHDYVRMHEVLNTYYLSRSAIACMNPTEEEMCAGSLLYLVETNPLPFIFSGISGDLVGECMKLYIEEVKRIHTFMQVLGDMQHRKE